MTAPHTPCQPDIVTRLRRTAVFVGNATGKENARWITEAADRIEELNISYDQMNNVLIATSDRVEELTKALGDLLECAEAECVSGSSYDPIQAARRALGISLEQDKANGA